MLSYTVSSWMRSHVEIARLVLYLGKPRTDSNHISFVRMAGLIMKVA